MAEIVLCVDYPLFSFDILISFVYAIMILNSDHVHNRQTRGKGAVVVGGITKLNLFYDHYNDLLLDLIAF